MSLASHVEQLKQKHRNLETDIVEKERHPGTDHLDIAALKRKKLQIKEEIERLEKQVH